MFNRKVKPKHLTKQEIRVINARNILASEERSFLDLAYKYYQETGIMHQALAPYIKQQEQGRPTDPPSVKDKNEKELKL